MHSRARCRARRHERQGARRYPNPEFVNYATEKLKEIASAMADTEEGVALGLELLKLQQEVGDDRAHRVMAVFSAFVTEHAQKVAVQFYRMGEAAGLAAAKQQQQKHSQRVNGINRRLQ